MSFYKIASVVGGLAVLVVLVLIFNFAGTSRDPVMQVAAVMYGNNAVVPKIVGYSYGSCSKTECDQKKAILKKQIDALNKGTKQFKKDCFKFSFFGVTRPVDSAKCVAEKDKQNALEKQMGVYYLLMLYRDNPSADCCGLLPLVKEGTKAVDAWDAQRYSWEFPNQIPEPSGFVGGSKRGATGPVR